MFKFFRNFFHIKTKNQTFELTDIAENASDTQPNSNPLQPKPKSRISSRNLVKSSRKSDTRMTKSLKDEIEQSFLRVTGKTISKNQ